MCHEQQLSLTCHSNQSHALQWTIILPNGNGMYIRNVLTTGNIPRLPIEVAGKSVTVSFSRQSATPLISILSIESTIAELNGTIINCSTANAAEMTFVHIIGRKCSY